MRLDGFPTLLLATLTALLVDVQCSFSLANIEKELAAFSYDDMQKQTVHHEEPYHYQPPQPPQQYSPPVQQPYPSYNIPVSSYQPLVIPYPQQQSQPTLISLQTESKHRSRHHHRHHHYRRNRLRDYDYSPLQQPPPQQNQQQYSIQSPSMFQNSLSVGTLCQRQAVSDRAQCGMKISCLLTQCQIDGSFAPRQCDPTTGHCWCVDNNGQEIDRTRVTTKSSSAAFLEVQCNLRSSAIEQENVRVASAPPPREYHSHKQHSLSLEEIESIIAKTAKKMVESDRTHSEQEGVAIEPPITVLGDSQPHPQGTSQSAHARSCAGHCRSHCSTSVDIMACMSTCETTCK